MKGDRQVITLPNASLRPDLPGVNHSSPHARLCHHWGYGRLYERVRKESIEEMKHADELIERILYLEGMPNVQRYGKVNVGQTVPEQFQLDLQLEYDAVKRLNEGIEACRTAGDNGTRTLLELILHEEEAHVDWLETQQETIKQIGAGTYLSEQLK